MHADRSPLVGSRTAEARRAGHTVVVGMPLHENPMSDEPPLMAFAKGYCTYRSGPHGWADLASDLGGKCGNDSNMGALPAATTAWFTDIEAFGVGLRRLRRGGQGKPARASPNAPGTAVFF